MKPDYRKQKWLWHWVDQKKTTKTKEYNSLSVNAMHMLMHVKAVNQLENRTHICINTETAERIQLTI